MPTILKEGSKPLYLGIYNGFNQQHHYISESFSEIQETLLDFEGIDKLDLNDIDFYEIKPIKVTMNKTYVVEPISLASDNKE